jgi:hypothetical protein
MANMILSVASDWYVELLLQCFQGLVDKAAGPWRLDRCAFAESHSILALILWRSARFYQSGFTIPLTDGLLIVLSK